MEVWDVNVGGKGMVGSADWKYGGRTFRVRQG